MFFEKGRSSASPKPERYPLVEQGALDSMASCNRVTRGCKYNPPHMSKHHKWWPGVWYTTPLEKRFRNHSVNVEVLCRCMHDLEHLKKPPKKPTRGFMVEFLERHK